MAKFSETSNAKKGGLFVGDSHAEGGIPAIVTDTGQPIEVEGGEAIINKKATALHWEELSKINQSAGGGVPIPPPDDADKVLEKYNQGGTINNKEKKLIFDKWKKLVNMTYTELSRYYHSKEGKESGLSESEAKKQGISSGRESAEWILKMKKTNWKKWTDDMWKWANKQISFISRMSGLQGDLTNDKGKKTRKYQALLIWGNNPKKKNAYQFNFGGSTAHIEELAKGKKIDENTPKVKLATINKIKKLSDRIVEIDRLNLGDLDDYTTYNGNISWRERSKLVQEQTKLEAKLNEICDSLSQSQCMSIDSISFQGLNAGGDYGYEEEEYKTGGGIPETSNTYAFVTSTSTTGKKLFKVFDHIPTNKEVYDYYQQVNKKIGTPIEIVDSSISIEVLSGFDRERFLKLLNEVALIKFSSKIKDIKELMFSFDSKTFNVYEFEAELNYGRIVKVKMVDGVIFLEDKYEQGGVPEYHLGGDMSKHLAPNGRSSNLTHEQWHLVRTPAFKKWFGDWENSPETASKVVDRNGEPLVVWHGSKYKFNTFEKHKVNFNYTQSIGFHFSDLKERALIYSNGGFIYEVFLNIRNPLLPNWAFTGKFPINRDLAEEAEEYIDNNRIKLKKEVIEGNYDGIIAKGFSYTKSFVAFEPNQIKLADGTNTTFDGSNSDIRFETGGAVQKSSPDTYENNLLQIRVIGGDYAYYTKVNQEWKFLSESIVFKLKEGAKHELEHIGTIEAFKRKDIPNEIVATFIAYDHINEDQNYYKKLEQAIPEKMEQGKKIDSEKYTYALTIRPFDIGTYPKQHFIRVVQEAPEYKYGLLEYSFPLDDTAIQHYSLAPVSEILQYDQSTIDYYEGNYAKVKIERDSKNIPSLIVDFYDKETNEKTHSSELTGKQFREKINSGEWKIINQDTNQIKIPQTESLRYFVENQYSSGMLSVGTQITKYEDLDELRSIILRLIKEKEKQNEYSIPYSSEELSNIHTLAVHEFNSQKSLKKDLENTKIEELKPKESLIKETLMEKEPENPTGLVTNNWNEVPVRWKNVKATRPVTFSINPYDKGLQSILKVFTGDDDLRPIMSAIRFEEKGLVVTDAHKLLHIAYKHSDFIGNYPSLNSQKAYGKYTSPEDIQKQLNEGKFPNWEAVIPRDSEYVYEIDTLKLYQYCKVAVNYANKTTNQVTFKYDNKAIGFNVKFMIDSLEAMMKIQKSPILFIHLTEPYRAAILSFEKSFSVVSSTYTLLMPVILYRGDDKVNSISQLYGAADIDFNKSLGCYFDFTDNKIHNANGTIAEYKETYGDSGGLPLDIITLMDRFIKISKPSIPILENVLVDGNGIRVDNLDSRIEIANDWDIPQGLYSISNNALVKSGINANIEDYPRITKRVPTSNEIFSINADVFKFYVEKASNHISNDDLRPVMNGICFEAVNSKLSIVSTDAHTLFHADLSKYAPNYSHNFSFIVPDIKQILNFCKNINSEKVNFYVDNLNPVNFRIGAGRIHFEGRLEDGKYPNWRAIVPETFSKQLIFDLKDMYNCLNNELAKSFSKDVEEKPKDLTIFNQSNKIFISEKQDRNKPDEAKTKEICEVKITKEEFNSAKSFNIDSNFVLLMPVMNTNGTNFNFNVGKFNDVISTIGKEKVIIDYNTLSNVYIFTSDNLDFNTSDVYKPKKSDKPISTKTKYVGRPSNREKTLAAIEKNPPAAYRETKPTFSSEAIKLIPHHQMQVLKSTKFSEMEDVISRLNSVAKVTPKLYGQDGVKDKMIYLHYFYANQDWYVTELDKSTGECFGYANLGYGAELGYMSIPEFVSNGKVELDFYFEPKKWSAIAKPDDSAFEKQNKAVKPLVEKPKSIPKTIKPDFETQTFSAKDDFGRPFLFIVGETPTDKQGAIKYLNNGYWIDNQKGFNGLITSYFKDIDTMKNNISAKYYNQIFNEETLSKSKPLKEKVLGIEYKVGTKGHAKAVAQKKQFEEISKSESGTSDDNELKDAVRGLEAFMKTTSDATEKAQLKQAINGLKALSK